MAQLSRGDNLGNGVWQVAVDQLSGLTLTPPPLFSGTITLSVSVVVTDTATFSSSPEPVIDVSESSAVPLIVTVRMLPTSVEFSGGIVAENSPTGTVVGLVTATGGHQTETFTVRFVATTGYNFTVDANGTVRVGTQIARL